MIASFSSPLLLCFFLFVLFSTARVEGASVSLYADTQCQTLVGTQGGFNSNGACTNVQTNEYATLVCTNNQATVNLYQGSGCSVNPYITFGPGTGDGNTCIAGNNGESVKVNCNSAFATYSISFSILLVAILFTILFQ